MAEKVQSVYQAVCDVLAEPQGLTSGIYTEAQFLEDFREVLWDLVQRTGIVKALVVEALTAGSATVTLPDHVLDDVADALYSMRYLHYATAEEMDNLLGQWRNATGVPKRWHQDRLPQGTVGVQPTPAADGDRVAFTTPMYGTISEASGATLDLDYSAPLYGVPAEFSGPAFVETIVPLRGTISKMVPSGANLLLVAVVKPLLRRYTLEDYIDVLPVSFLPYAKYGILARVFGRDGETRDVLRQQYCGARYQECVNLATTISTEALEGEE